MNAKDGRASRWRLFWLLIFGALMVLSAELTIMYELNGATLTVWWGLLAAVSACGAIITNNLDFGRPDCREPITNENPSSRFYANWVTTHNIMRAVYCMSAVVLAILAFATGQLTEKLYLGVGTRLTAIEACLYALLMFWLAFRIIVRFWSESAQPQAEQR